MRIKNQFFTSIILIISLILMSCAKLAVSYKTATLLALDTVVQFQIYDDIANQVFIDLESYVRDFENHISSYKEETDVYKINHSPNHEIQVNELTYDLITLGAEYSALSNGLFDITIFPLVDIWGIGTDTPKVPSEEMIKTAVDLVDYTQIELNSENHTVKLKKEGMGIDLGGIAKGFLADRLKEFLINRGINTALINLGGNVLAFGKKEYKVGIRDPFGGIKDVALTVAVRDKSIVTSGTDERFFESNGKRYHHILDTRTGYPAENDLVSVTIISDYSVDGDALSTTIFLLGKDKGIEFIKSLRQDIDAIFITKDRKIYCTSKNLEILKVNPNFKLH